MLEFVRDQSHFIKTGWWIYDVKIRQVGRDTWPWSRWVRIALMGRFSWAGFLGDRCAQGHHPSLQMHKQRGFKIWWWTQWAKSIMEMRQMDWLPIIKEMVHCGYDFGPRPLNCDILGISRALLLEQSYLHPLWLYVQIS